MTGVVCYTEMGLRIGAPNLRAALAANSVGRRPAGGLPSAPTEFKLSAREHISEMSEAN